MGWGCSFCLFELRILFRLFLFFFFVFPLLIEELAQLWLWRFVWKLSFHSSTCGQSWFFTFTCALIAFCVHLLQCILSQSLDFLLCSFLFDLNLLLLDFTFDLLIESFSLWNIEEVSPISSFTDFENPLSLFYTFLIGLTSIIWLETFVQIPSIKTCTNRSLFSISIKSFINIFTCMSLKHTYYIILLI